MNLQKTPTISELENAARLEPNDFRKQVDLARNYEANGRFNDSKEELFNLRFQLATGQLENHARLGQVKREVARVLTELREREISAAEDLSLDNGEESDND